MNNNSNNNNNNDNYQQTGSYGTSSENMEGFNAEQTNNAPTSDQNLQFNTMPVDNQNQPSIDQESFTQQDSAGSYVENQQTTVEYVGTQSTNSYQQEAEALYGQPTSSGNNPAKTMGIISMVLGILSILPGCCLGAFSLILSIPAVILAIVSLIKMKEQVNQEGKGFAVAGLIIGGIGIIWGVVAITIVGFFGADMMNEFRNNM